jgi:hypothetical protein
MGDGNSDAIDLDALPKRHAVYECSEFCACRSSGETGESSSCGNRRAQGGVRRRLVVRPTATSTHDVAESGYNKGLGVFAREDLRKGTFICLYAGEVISTAEARARWKQRQGHDNYVLVLREIVTTAEGGEETLRTIVDPTRVGNVGSVRCLQLASLGVAATASVADPLFFSRRFISEPCVLITIYLTNRPQ